MGVSMAGGGFKRKLLGVPIADVKGFCRRLSDIEVATVQTFKAYRTSITDLSRQYDEELSVQRKTTSCPILAKPMGLECARIIQNGGFLHAVVLHMGSTLFLP